MKHSDLPGRILKGLGSFCYFRYRLVLATCLIFALASVTVAARNLTVDTDWLVLFSDKHEEIRELRKWRSLLPGSKDIAIIVSGGSLEERRKAVESAGHYLQAETALWESPLTSIDSEPFLRSGLYFLGDQSLAELKAQSQRAEVLVSLLGEEQNFDFLDVVRKLKASEQGRQFLADGIRVILDVSDPRRAESPTESLFHPPRFQSDKLQRVLGNETQVPEKLYLSLDQEKTLLVLVRPILPGGRKEAVGPAVDRLREIVGELRVQSPNLKFALTGEPVLIIDEQKTIARDSVVTTLISLALILLIFRFGFREILRPVLSLLTLFIGLLWTVGAVTLTVGHLNFITVTYVPILVGIGIDFAIHITFRYYEFKIDVPGPEAIEMTMLTSAWDTTLGVVTTVAAFSSLLLVGFRGVAELAVIAVLGVALCQLSACTFLPALLGLLDARGTRMRSQGRRDLENCHQSLMPWSSGLILLCLAFCIASLFLAPRAKFDIHLLRMQNQELESVRTELQLVARGKTSALTATVPAENLAQAKDFESALLSLESVNEVISLSTFLPDNSSSRSGLVEAIILARPSTLKLLQRLKSVPKVQARTALEILEELKRIEGPDPSSRELRTVTLQLEQRLGERGPGPLIDHIEGLLNQSNSTATRLIDLLKRQSPIALSQEQLPEALTSRLFTTDGRFALKVFPKHDIWQPQELDHFLKEVRSVSGSVTGEPVLIELFERLVLATHWKGLGLSLLAISAVLLVVMRNLKLAILAALPTLFSVLNLLGFMGFFSLDFNPANFVAIPMLLGIGSVFGLHSVLRMKELGNDRLLCCSTGPAILLSAATSAAGFASLTAAAHLGIASLGGLVSMGLTMNAFVSLVLLPALVRKYPSLLDS